MAKASDNQFPKVLLVPTTTGAVTAPAGTQALLLDSGDSNKLKRKDSSGTVTTIEGGSGGGGTWSSYTPTWAATSGTPNVGSTGSLTGSYTQTGKTVMFRLNLVLGGTGISTGTGTWNFTLPVAHVAPPSGIAQHGIMLGGYFEDLAFRAYASPGGRLVPSSTTTFEITYSMDNAASSGAGGAGVLGATTPFSWATGDYLSVYGTYQAA